MIINNQFELASIVYLVTDPDQFERMVTGIVIGINGTIQYRLVCATDTSLHWENEVTVRKDMKIALGINKEESQ